MKSKLGKIMTVTTATLAILVACVSASVILGGPNWIGQAQSIEGYSFTYQGGEQPTWTATNNDDNSTVKTAKALPDVIPPVLDQKISAIKTKVADLGNSRQVLEARKKTAELTSQSDEAALQQRIETLRATIGDLNTQAANTSAEVLRVNEQIAEVEATIEDRRGDVQRLAATVAVVDSDTYRLKQLRQQLADLISQIDAQLATAAERETQLKQLLGDR